MSTSAKFRPKNTVSKIRILGRLRVECKNMHTSVSLSLQSEGERLFLEAWRSSIFPQSSLQRDGCSRFLEFPRSDSSMRFLELREKGSILKFVKFPQKGSSLRFLELRHKGSNLIFVEFPQKDSSLRFLEFSQENVAV